MPRFWLRSGIAKMLPGYFASMLASVELQLTLYKGELYTQRVIRRQGRGAATIVWRVILEIAAGSETRKLSDLRQGRTLIDAQKG